MYEEEGAGDDSDGPLAALEAEWARLCGEVTPDPGAQGDGDDSAGPLAEFWKAWQTGLIQEKPSATENVWMVTISTTSAAAMKTRDANQI